MAGITFDPVEATLWCQQLAAVLGTEAPSEAETAALLSLASVAANASERLAAPLSCWLVGRSGCSPDQALGLARELLERLAGPP